MDSVSASMSAKTTFPPTANYAVWNRNEAVGANHNFFAFDAEVAEHGFVSA